MSTKDEAEKTKASAIGTGIIGPPKIKEISTGRRGHAVLPENVDIKIDLNPGDLPEIKEIDKDGSVKLVENVKRIGNRSRYAPTDHVSARRSRFNKLTDQIPFRIERSIEYEVLIKENRKVNPYTKNSSGYFIFNTIKMMQEANDDAFIKITDLIDVLVKNGIHILCGGFFKFLTRFRDVIEILGHPCVECLKYDNATFSVKLSDDFKKK